MSLWDRLSILKSLGKEEGDVIIAVPAVMVPFKYFDLREPKKIVVGNGYIGFINAMGDPVIAIPMFGRVFEGGKIRECKESIIDTDFWVDRIQGVVPRRKSPKEVADFGVVKVGYMRSYPYVSLVGMVKLRLTKRRTGKGCCGADVFVVDDSDAVPDAVFVRIANTYSRPYVVVWGDDVITTGYSSKKIKTEEGEEYEEAVAYALVKNGGDVFINYRIEEDVIDWIGADVVNVFVGADGSVRVKKKYVVDVGVVKEYYEVV